MRVINNENCMGCTAGYCSSGCYNTVKERFQKDYARTTVVTFLGKMADKGYLNTYRKGRQAFVHPICDEAVYTRGIIKHDADFWFDGDSFKLMSALCSEKKLTKEEVDKIKELLDGIDC